MAGYSNKIDGKLRPEETRPADATVQFAIRPLAEVAFAATACFWRGLQYTCEKKSNYNLTVTYRRVYQEVTEANCSLFLIAARSGMELMVQLLDL
jgi:hypothetical protein